MNGAGIETVSIFLTTNRQGKRKIWTISQANPEPHQSQPPQVSRTTWSRTAVMVPIITHSVLRLNLNMTMIHAISHIAIRTLTRTCANLYAGAVLFRIKIKSARPFSASLWQATTLTCWLLPTSPVTRWTSQLENLLFWPHGFTPANQMLPGLWTVLSTSSLVMTSMLSF